MKNSAIRKFVNFILINAIVLQIAFFLIAVIEVGRVQNSRETSLMADKIHWYTDNVQKIFYYIDEYIDYLTTNKVFEFTAVQNSYRGERLLAERDRINKLIETRKYANRYINSFYILGANDSCINVLDADSEYAEKINVELLFRSGVIDYFDSHFEEMFCFEKENISFRNEELLGENFDAVKSYVNNLDGKYIYAEYAGNNNESLVVLELNSDYLKECFFSDDALGVEPYILSSHREYVFGTEPSSLENIVYEKKLDKTGNFLVLTQARKGITGFIFVGIMALIMLCVLGICVVISKRYASNLQKPYISLSNLFVLTRKSRDLQKISIASKNRRKNDGILFNIFFTTFTVVIIPSIITGAIYLLLISGFCNELENESFKYYENQMLVNIDSEMTDIKKEIDKISFEDFSEICRIATNRSSQNDSRLIRNPDVFFESYIIYDENVDVVMYSDARLNSTVYVNLKQSIVDKIKVTDKDFYIFAVDSDNLKYNTNNKTLGLVVKKIYNRDESIAGFFVGVMKYGNFQNIKIGNVSDFVIADINDMVIESSDYELDDLNKKALNKSAPSSISAKYDIVLYTTQQSDYVKDVLNSCLIWFLSVIITILAVAWLYSIRFTLPFTEIIKDISRKRNGIKIEWIKGYSELETVVNAYNEMVDYVNLLINEKIQMETKQNEMELLKNKAELNALQHQINPHFLYNSMEMLNMRFFELRDYEMCDIVSALAQLFRYCINDIDSNVCLNDEVEYASKYATIQEKRFYNTFSVIWNIDDNTKEIPVLKMIIQPLIENAITHGFKSTRKIDGKITVSSYRSEELLKINVTDNGIGIEPKQLEMIKRSVYDKVGDDCVALRNIHERIKLYNDDDFGLNIESEFLKYTSVTLTIRINDIEKN